MIMEIYPMWHHNWFNRIIQVLPTRAHLQYDNKVLYGNWRAFVPKIRASRLFIFTPGSSIDGQPDRVPLVNWIKYRWSTSLRSSDLFVVDSASLQAIATNEHRMNN